MYLGGDESLTSCEWIDTHVRAHGALGPLYPTKTWTAPNPHGCMKEGDTPSWFFFLPAGGNVPTDPTRPGWGGQFIRAADGWFVDVPVSAGDEARATVHQHRAAFQADFARRMSWCSTAADDSSMKTVILYGAPFAGMSSFIRGLKAASGARVVWYDSGPLGERAAQGDAIVFLHDEARDELARVLASGKPVLSRSIPQLELGVPVIHMDDEGPARVMAEEMVKNGARSLFYWGMPKPFSHRRAAGTRAAAEAASVPFTETQTLEETIAALRGAQKPAGLVCMNDERCYLVSEALQGTGLGVPADVMLGGFDNTALPEAAWAVPLTTVILPIEEQGRLAARLLLQAAAGTPIAHTIHTTSAPHVVRRQSTRSH
jgi:hypothetical protein